MRFKTFSHILAACVTALSMNTFASVGSSERLLGLPERAQNARTGSQFIQEIKKAPLHLREKMILDEIMSGNIPEFQRQLVPIERTISSGSYRGKKLRYWVLPDYLAVGSNEDFVRVPMNMHSIKILMQKLNLSIPTTVMVDDIYAQAQVKLKPTTLPCSSAMSSVHYFQQHNALVQKQIMQSDWKPGMLVAGHKKDVVQSLHLLAKPNAVAIYGWHKPDHQPIQPLSTVHGADYYDYSHGVRFVANLVEVNGKAMDLHAVLSQKLVETLAHKTIQEKPRS